MCEFSEIFFQKTITTTVRHTEIASCSLHIMNIMYNTTCVNGKEGSEVQVYIGTNKNNQSWSLCMFAQNYLYARKLRTLKANILVSRKQLSISQKRFSRHVYFFIKKGKIWINGNFLSARYRPSPIPSVGLEIPSILKFSYS